MLCLRLLGVLCGGGFSFAVFGRRPNRKNQSNTPSENINAFVWRLRLLGAFLGGWFLFAVFGPRPHGQKTTQTHLKNKSMPLCCAFRRVVCFRADGFCSPCLVGDRLGETLKSNEHTIRTNQCLYCVLSVACCVSRRLVVLRRFRAEASWTKHQSNTP